jgi:hypothetical protein
MGTARIKKSMVICLVSATTMLALASSAGAVPTVSHTYPAFDSAAATANYSQTATHEAYVVLQGWETKRLHELKSQNPSLDVLVYKNLSFAAESRGISSTGVATQEAPDEWFLKNLQGERIASNGYKWLWAMDVGSPEYQKRWYENVIGELESQGWDGVFLDDANPTMKYAYDPSQVAKYPNDTAYSAATESALAYIGPRIQAHGKLAIANFAAWVEYPSTCDSWLRYVNGALDEMFTKWGRNTGEGYRSEGQWNAQLAEVKYAASQNKTFIGFTQGSVGETQAARFGYGTALLGGNGSTSYAFTPNYTSETWMSEYEYELGNPTEAESKEASGVHRRLFEHGLVLVNPTSSSHSVSFGGSYSGSGLSQATGATMEPHTALVLTGSQSPTPTPTPTPKKKSRKQATTASIKVSGTATSSQVALYWKPVGDTPDKAEVRVYKVVRDNRPLARTSRRHRVDRRVARGRSYRYRIVGLDPRGRIVAKSRAVRVRLGDSPRKIS